MKVILEKKLVHSRFLKSLISKRLLSSAQADTSEFQPFTKPEIKSTWVRTVLVPHWSHWIPQELSKDKTLFWSEQIHPFWSHLRFQGPESFYIFAQCKLELDSYNAPLISKQLIHLRVAETFPCLHALIKSYLLEERFPKVSSQSMFPLRVSQRRYWNYPPNSTPKEPLPLP